jgi:hypothetical protein
VFFSNPATEDKTLYHKGEKDVCDIKISYCHSLYAKNQLIMKMIFSIAWLIKAKN